MNDLAPILIVAKDEDFLRHCENMAEDASCESHSFLVTSRFEDEKTELISMLRDREVHVVLAQYQMSPYTVVELLQDLTSVTPFPPPYVLALSLDGLGSTTEIQRNGGHVFRTVGPGQTLVDAVNEGLKELREYKGIRHGNREVLVELLDRFTDERSLQSFIVWLFRKIGFREVRASHGPTEHGRDLVFYEVNQLGEREYVGMQVKLGDIHASVHKPESATALFLQALEALSAPILISGTEHHIDKFIVLTNGTINEGARLKLLHLLTRTRLDRRVYFYGREAIAELMVRNAIAPEAVRRRIE